LKEKEQRIWFPKNKYVEGDNWNQKIRIKRTKVYREIKQKEEENYPILNIFFRN
jgi:hypothetical protein